MCGDIIGTGSHMTGVVFSCPSTNGSVPGQDRLSPQSF